MAELELEGVILDIDYISKDGRSIIRMTLRSGNDVYTILDPSFYPYFRLLPFNENIDTETIAKMRFSDQNEQFGIRSVSKRTMNLAGKPTTMLKVEALATKHIPTISEQMEEFGERYEYDILFWKRYLIDKGISPLGGAKVKAHDENGNLLLDEIKAADVHGTKLRHICFDIETYNPATVPRPNEDPCIMISYATDTEHAVLTTKKINREFVKTYKDESEMILAFVDVVKRIDPDFIVGYNSSNFDVPYLLKRAEKLGAAFDITRYGEQARPEHHGLLEAVKIPGRVNVDIYNITKFVSIVGASEKLIKLNSFTLGNVYAAITGDTKITVDKKNIWQIWEGTDADLEEFADYSLSDSISLNTLYNFFIPLELEVAKVAGTTIGEASISTTGQLVEYLLMRYASINNEVVLGKPSDGEIARRIENPIEGAYVKTPDAGIYDNIAVFDFRSLYPSIIISYNIDPSTLCKDCDEYFESPDGTRFKKKPFGIVPTVLKLLLAERASIKKAFKKDPDNKTLAARSSALKILANSFYGYLGYARSRWYSRPCAGSVTAFGRLYITKTIEQAENAGFKVLYSDTDSIFLLMQEKSKEQALDFLSKLNKTLPEAMELELEDFYVRGVFVGKKGAEGGAKKKYALLSEGGRVKIRGFELVRRDWSYIARDTQKKVLEAILKEGSESKAVEIVKQVITQLREGKAEMKNLIIYTQLRKKIDNYDARSPELGAAKKAIEMKKKTKAELEGATIGYIITRNGNSISEKAEMDDTAQNYDPDYYINKQVIPATLKILKELGFSEEELKGGGSQKRL